MPRYFIEVAYKGTRYSGFQVQENANTVQAEVEKAFQTLHRQPVELTGSSRTDAGVHALQNYFHFDYNEALNPSHFVYKMNAILPGDIVVKNLFTLPESAHSRFDAIGREYEYHFYRYKDPFLRDVAYFYPYRMNQVLLEEAAALVQSQTNFFAFSKTNTQVKNFTCRIYKSQWVYQGNNFIYNIEGNRFLRGMVRLLTASMLQVGRSKLSLDEFAELFLSNKKKCGFSIPAHGLFLKNVKYPEGYFK